MENGIKMLLTETEAARLLGFSPRFLQQRRYTGGGPKFVRVSARAVRYRPEDLERWAAEHVRASTSDESGAHGAVWHGTGGWGQGVGPCRSHPLVGAPP